MSSRLSVVYIMSSRFYLNCGFEGLNLLLENKKNWTKNLNSTWNLFEGSALVFFLQVLVDESLHLGELVQTSPSAGFDFTRMN